MSHARIGIRLLAALLVAGPAAAQPAPPAGGPDPADRSAAALRAVELAQDPEQLAAAVAQLRLVSTEAAAPKAQADRLLSESQQQLAAGHGGEARRALAHAAAILAGAPFGAAEEYAASLALDPAALVVDTDAPLPAVVTQRYRIDWSGGAPPSLRVGNEPVAEGAAPRLLWSTELPLRDLAGEPLGVELDLRGLPAGAYRLRAELLDHGQRVRAWAVPIALVEHLARDAAALGARLDAISDHDAAVASARYPFDLARAVNGWRRRLPADFDFTVAIARSRELVAALERGADPLQRATGEQRRAYASEAAGEILPYRLYVPERWDGRRALPLLVLLHGDGEAPGDFFQGARRAALLKLAAQYQFIVVAPSGYRAQAAFGSAATRLLERAGTRPGIAPGMAGALAERDVLDVTERVATEYGVDRRRIYLYGIGSGGSGAWFLGARDGAAFAALASCGTVPPVGDAGALKEVPALAVIGGRDPDLRRQAVREAVQQLRALRLPVSRLEIGGQSSADACGAPPPAVFAFLARIQKRLSAAGGAGAAARSSADAPPGSR